MPSPLDLSLSAVTCDAMTLSARKSPRMTLRHVPGYSGEKGPISSTSARFSFNHLISTPPPSPSLPALVPRHGKPLPSHTPQQFVRIFLWLCGVLSILYFGFCNMQANRSVPSVGWSTHDDQEYEMVGEDKLPGFPTPLVVSDKRGRAKWTVSIPVDFAFPLEPELYADICRQTAEVSSHVRDLHKYKHVTHAAHFDYHHVDPNFMDVAVAVEHGMLPNASVRPTARDWEPKTGSHDSLMVGEVAGHAEKDMCSKSLTFVMETYDAGLGPTLMMLWMAYGLAQKEERAFFIDDSRWAYGNYSNLFKLPPVPNCRPPPRQEILPCPHHARHLLVSDATRRWTFGGAFNEAFEDPRKMEVFRQKPIFDLARAGYEALFHLADSDSNYVTTRLATLRAKAEAKAPQAQDGITVGLHVRRGDRHPMEFQYAASYIPLERFTDKARDLLHQAFNTSGPKGEENMSAEMRSVLLIASDDPEVYESDTFSHAVRAQELIRLASNKFMSTPQDVEPTGHPLFKRFVEETVGWEGGFFAGMFWNLGRSADIPSTEPPNPKLPPTPAASRLRELVARAYLLDLAVLGGASDAVICTVSSTGCALLAVMMGWEKSIEKQAWTNIDGDFEWRGVSW